MKLLLLTVPLALFPNVERPPAGFQSLEPVTVQVTFATPDWVNTECRRRMPRYRDAPRQILACAGARRRWHQAWAILPHGCLFADNYAGMVCHEVGHVRGWIHLAPTA